MNQFTPESVLEEEKRLRLPYFDYDLAWRIGVAIRDLAMVRNLPISIEVAHGADPVFYAILPGATPDNTDWVARKRNVVFRMQHSTLYMRLFCEQTGRNFNTSYRLPEQDYAAAPGGFPLLLDNGTYIGAVAVSGLPGYEDHTLITEALAKVVASARSGASAG